MADIYVLVEGMHPVKEVDRPNWFMEDGTAVSDVWLVDNENIYPVDEGDIPDITDPELQYYVTNPMYQWTVCEYCVKKTYEVKLRSFEELVDIYKGKLKTTRDLYVLSGMKYETTAGPTINIPTNIDDLVMLNSQISAVIGNYRIENGLIKLLDGSFTPTSNVELFLIGEKIYQFIDKCNINENRIYQEIITATTSVDLKLINMNTGWPEECVYDPAS